MLTTTHFSHQGEPFLSQRDVESNVLFQPKLLSLSSYECDLGDVHREVTVQGEMFTIKLWLAAFAKPARLPKPHVHIQLLFPLSKFLIVRFGNAQRPLKLNTQRKILKSFKRCLEWLQSITRNWLRVI